MNKSIGLHQNASQQSAMANRINRNLSPSLARLQALAAKAAPSNNAASADKSAGASPVSEAKLAAPSPSTTQPTPSESTNSASKTFHPQPPLATHHKPASGSAPITPWIIASITLTLALFSGNYAWQTQQEVEELSLRLEQIEALPTTPPTDKLQKTDDTLVRAEQELASLKQSQQQLVASLAALQNKVDTNTEQAHSQLATLQTSITSLSVKAEEASPNETENKALITQKGESESSAASSVATKSNTTDDTTKNTDLAAGSTATNWVINIASFSDPRAANESYEKVLKVTDKASIKATRINDKTLYRVRAESHSSLAEAEREALTLQNQLGLSGLWVSRD